MIDPINAPHFTSARRDALAASMAAQAETKRRNDDAARAAALRAEAAAIGAELDPDALEQGDIQ
ncbi:hypothetical protein [Acidovorax sp.]|uniref:hypothetical protein n=1 Tax=Acidovorax sp. TaxID=1872122 RepID=UPI0031D9F502